MRQGEISRVGNLRKNHNVYYKVAPVYKAVLVLLYN